MTGRHGRFQFSRLGETQMPDKDARNATKTADNRATILLVDDNTDVREITAILLNDLGYAVIEAESGQAVLAQLESGTTADLLIVDFAMPGMSGLEMVTKARVKWPALKAIFVTGYADAPHMSNLLVGEAVLRKPFSISDLETAINQALARP
jgi:CheY-like chemotaxis protein